MGFISLDSAKKGITRVCRLASSFILAYFSEVFLVAVETAMLKGYQLRETLARVALSTDLRLHN